MLKNIEAGVLSVAYEESGPVAGPPVFTIADSAFAVLFWTKIGCPSMGGAEALVVSALPLDESANSVICLSSIGKE